MRAFLTQYFHFLAISINEFWLLSSFLELNCKELKYRISILNQKLAILRLEHASCTLFIYQLWLFWVHQALQKAYRANDIKCCAQNLNKVLFTPSWSLDLMMWSSEPNGNYYCSWHVCTKFKIPPASSIPLFDRRIRWPCHYQRNFMIFQFLPMLSTLQSHKSTKAKKLELCTDISLYPCQVMNTLFWLHETIFHQRTVFLKEVEFRSLNIIAFKYRIE